MMRSTFLSSSANCRKPFGVWLRVSKPSIIDPTIAARTRVRTIVMIVVVKIVAMITVVIVVLLLDCKIEDPDSCLRCTGLMVLGCRVWGLWCRIAGKQIVLLLCSQSYTYIYIYIYTYVYIYTYTYTYIVYIYNIISLSLSLYVEVCRRESQKTRDPNHLSLISEPGKLRMLSIPGPSYCPELGIYGP